MQSIALHQTSKKGCSSLCFFVSQKIFISCMYGAFYRPGIVNVHFKLDQVSKTLIIYDSLDVGCVIDFGTFTFR